MKIMMTQYESTGGSEPLPRYCWEWTSVACLGIFGKWVVKSLHDNAPVIGVGAGNPDTEGCSERVL